MQGHGVSSRIVMVIDSQLRAGCSWRVLCLPRGQPEHQRWLRAGLQEWEGLERVRRMVSFGQREGRQRVSGGPQKPGEVGYPFDCV